MTDIEQLIRASDEAEVHTYPSFAWKVYTGDGPSQHDLSPEEATRRIAETLASIPDPLYRRQQFQQLARVTTLPVTDAFRMMQKARHA